MNRRRSRRAQTVLLRYLSMRLAGAADAAALLMEPPCGGQTAPI